MNSSPLFIIGVARSGTTLYAHLLSQHPRIAIASDVLFPLFKYFRTQALLSAQAHFPFVRLSSPLHHYYFSKEALRERAALEQTSLDLCIPSVEYDELITSLAARAEHEAGDLIPYLKEIREDTFARLINTLLHHITHERKAQTHAWVGTKEVWTIEFLPQLKKAFPHARFLIVLRSPVDCLHSAITLPDHAQRPHALSFLRHWRKHAAYTWEFLHHKDYQDSICVSRYEDLTSHPEKEVQRIADFLSVEDLSLILDNPILHPVTKKIWGGNSSQGKHLASVAQIPQAQAKELTTEQEEIALLSDYLCGPEATLFHYESAFHPQRTRELPSHQVAETLFSSRNAEVCSWQDNALSVLADEELEHSRWLSLKNGESTQDERYQNFIHESVWRAVSQISSEKKL